MNCSQPWQFEPGPEPAHTLVSKNSVLICSVYWLAPNCVSVAPVVVTLSNEPSACEIPPGTCAVMSPLPLPTVSRRMPPPGFGRRGNCGAYSHAAGCHCAAGDVARKQTPAGRGVAASDLRQSCRSARLAAAYARLPATASCANPRSGASAATQLETRTN